MRKRWIFWIIALCACHPVAAQTVHLEDYVQTAKQYSPLLREYRNTVLSNSIDSEKIRASYKPQVMAASINSYAPTSSNFGYDQAVTNGGQFSTLVSANKTFVGRDNLNTQFNAVRLAGDSVRNTSLIAGQDLTRTITQQYLTTYGDQQLLLANEEIKLLLQNEGAILKSLTQNNIYRQTDYLTFLVTQKQQDLQLRQLRIQYQTDFATLNYLCGIVDTSAFRKTLALPQMDVQLFENSFSTAFYRRYILDSLRLANEGKLVNLAYRPKLGVFADAGYNSSQLNTFYNHFGASAGFSVNLPIYDGGRRKLSLRQIALQEDTRQGYQDFFVQQYNQQIAGLLQQLSATQALLDDIEEQISYSKGLIEVNEKLLQTGDARIPDFVIAINNYLTAKTLLTQSRVGRLQIINQVNYWNR
jgi:outer membrane protein TolC